MLSSKMLCKNGNSISAIQRVWDYPKIQKQSVSAVSRNALFFRCGYCKVLLLVDENADEQLAAEVRQTVKDQLADDFIYASVSPTYLAGVIDIL